MKSKKFDLYLIWMRRWLLPRTDRRILKNVLRNGKSYPGDIVKSLRISQNLGIKKIFDLKAKGWLMSDGTSRVHLNPEKRKEVKVMTALD